MVSCFGRQIIPSLSQHITTSIHQWANGGLLSSLQTRLLHSKATRAERLSKQKGHDDNTLQSVLRERVGILEGQRGGEWWRGCISPVWLGRYPCFTFLPPQPLPVRKRARSIHPRFPGTPLHPDGQGLKTNWGYRGIERAMYGHAALCRQAICCDEEASLVTSFRVPLQAHCAGR